MVALYRKGEDTANTRGLTHLEGGTQAFDRKLLLAMRRPGDLAPIGPPALVEAARDVTALGGLAVLSLLTAIIAGFLSMDGKGRMALFMCAAVGTGLIVSLVLKDSFHRERPEIVPHGDYVSTDGFPSGHSMMSAVTYLTLGALLARSRERKRIKAFAILLAVPITFAVGLSRVYLGVHWPTDVLAGWTAGGVWALLCCILAQRQRTIERETEHFTRFGEASA